MEALRNVGMEMSQELLSDGVLGVEEKDQEVAPKYFLIMANYVYLIKDN